MKKIFILAIISITMITFVTAAWLFSINAGFSVTVESLPGYTSIDLDIPVLSVNTTYGADSVSGGTKFILNKDMTLNVSIIETYQDNSGGQCFGGQDDCTLEYFVENEGSLVQITDNQQVHLIAKKSSRELNATLSCNAYSCPQAISVEIILTEVLE